MRAPVSNRQFLKDLFAEIQTHPRVSVKYIAAEMGLCDKTLYRKLNPDDDGTHVSVADCRAIVGHLSDNSFDSLRTIAEENGLTIVDLRGVRLSGAEASVAEVLRDSAKLIESYADAVDRDGRAGRKITGEEFEAIERSGNAAVAAILRFLRSVSTDEEGCGE